MDRNPPGQNHGTGLVHGILRGIVWIGRAAAWLLIPILALVLTSVVLSAAKVGIIFQWEKDIFLFGSKLTLSSLGDLQWHMFGIMLMLSLAGALVSDAHVRVDFLRQHMSDRQRSYIDLFGHLVFLTPLCAVIVLHGYGFTMRSFGLGEGSNYDGLYDRFVLKAFIPIGFGMLLIAGLGLAFLRARDLLRKTGDGRHD